MVRSASEHARYFTLQLAENYLTGPLFRQILQRIERLGVAPDVIGRGQPRVVRRAAAGVSVGNDDLRGRGLAGDGILVTVMPQERACHRSETSQRRSASRGALTSAWCGDTDGTKSQIPDKEDSGDPAAPAVRFGDMIVLLNPAFEASRYTPLHRIVTNPNRQFRRYQAPVLVSVTSTADLATRWAFRAGRFLNTLFEKAASPEESTAIKNTMGHVDLYITHKLTRSEENPPECRNWKDVMTVDPSARLEQMQQNLKAETANNEAFFGKDSRPTLKEHWVRPFCGGAVLTHVKHGANLPMERAD